MWMKSTSGAQHSIAAKLTIQQICAHLAPATKYFGYCPNNSEEEECTFSNVSDKTGRDIDFFYTSKYPPYKLFVKLSSRFGSILFIATGRVPVNLLPIASAIAIIMSVSTTLGLKCLRSQ
jgi:hypothetical protein